MRTLGKLSRFCRTWGAGVDGSPPWIGLAFVCAIVLIHPILTYGQSPDVTSEVTGVACTIIGLVTGIVGKMLSFVFLAAGAVAAFVGKWAYVVGGIGAGLLLIIGPRILETAFTGSACTP